ncbi:hypothetical protein chiPu_0024283 [Chiloscyllium punctatum]|uniref:Uncharacterized protein n=1 Tax=Chiloscyllium punctatum TaxID=137246 RepID=A0A401TBI1_CHIPU|nr:hypothetical protein [Chiloscyllium punctatum]
MDLGEVRAFPPAFSGAIFHQGDSAGRDVRGAATACAFARGRYCARAGMGGADGRRHHLPPRRGVVRYKRMRTLIVRRGSMG